MVQWPLEGFPWAEAPGHRPQGMSYMLQFFSLNGISIPFQSRPKACKPFLYANPGCVGSPGVFITPGTYFMRFLFLMDRDNMNFHDLFYRAAIVTKLT